MNREGLDNIVGLEARIAAYGQLLPSGFPSTELVGFRAQLTAKSALVGFETHNGGAFGHGSTGIEGTELVGLKTPNTAHLVGFEARKYLLTPRTRESIPCVTLVLNNLIKDQQQKGSWYCSFFSKESHDEC